MNGRSSSPRGLGGPRRSLSQRPPCAEHGLATGPDGLCTLCKRRSSRPPSSRPFSAAPQQDYAPSTPASILTSLLGLVALVALGLALSVAFDLVQIDALIPMSAEEKELLAAHREQRPLAAPPSRDVTGPLQHQTEAARAAARAAEQIAEQARQLEAAAKAQVERESERAAVRDRMAQETAEQDRKRREMIESDMAERSLKRARENVSIVMYSTSWCPSCVAARDYMKGKSIPFTEHDIEKSPSARAIQRRLNPKGSIPTIDVEGAVLVGFSEQSLEKMIDVAAKKRVR